MKVLPKKPRFFLRILGFCLTLFVSGISYADTVTISLFGNNYGYDFFVRLSVDGQVVDSGTVGATLNATFNTPPGTTHLIELSATYSGMPNACYEGISGLLNTDYVDGTNQFLSWDNPPPGAGCGGAVPCNHNLLISFSPPGCGAWDDVPYTYQFTAHNANPSPTPTPTPTPTPVQGVDVSFAPVDQVWVDKVHKDHGVRFIVQDVWSGTSKGSMGLATENLATVAKNANGMGLAAYAVINPSLDGASQITQAFSAVKENVRTDQIRFLGVDIEWGSPPDPTKGLDRVQRYANAIWRVWTEGVPAAIYVNRDDWSRFTKSAESPFGTLEIQPLPPLWDIPLWNASRGPATLTPFAPFGPWTQRLGRQYVLRTTLEDVQCDFDVFNPRLFALPRPPVGCRPQLRIDKPTLAPGQPKPNFEFTGVVVNDVPPSRLLCPALATRIDAADMVFLDASGKEVDVKGFRNTNGTLAQLTLENPLMLNTLPVGAPVGESGKFTIEFPFNSTYPTPPSPGAVVAIQLSLSCAGLGGGALGPFDFSYRFFLP
jgi:hypothetical protein